MKPFEFKDMVMRTFAVQLTAKELGALTKFYDTSGTNTVDNKEFISHFMKLQRQGAERKRKARLTKIRQLEEATKAEELKHESTKMKNIEEKLRFEHDDKKSFLNKIRIAAQEYAIDSATVQEPLNAFKGPALNPDAFINTFRRAFLKIKLTTNEVGVLKNLLDANSGLVTIDGPRFLTWFYKLARRETTIMLGEAQDDITFESLRVSSGEDLLKAATSSVVKHKSQSPMKKNSSMTNSILPTTSADGSLRGEPLDLGSPAPLLGQQASPESKSPGDGGKIVPKGGKKLAIALISHASEGENASVYPRPTIQQQDPMRNYNSTKKKSNKGAISTNSTNSTKKTPSKKSNKKGQLQNSASDMFFFPTL
jgi:hypothetical protein